MTFGLDQYANRPKVDKKERREGESTTAWRRRVNFWHLEDTEVTEEAWAEQRAQVDNRITGQGVGMFGLGTPHQRAASMRSPGQAFGGDQVLEHRGGSAATSAPGSPVVQRAYVQEDEDQGQKVSPLKRALSSGEGWFVR
jgi:hypothetical protein